MSGAGVGSGTRIGMDRWERDVVVRVVGGGVQELGSATLRMQVCFIGRI